MSGLIEPLRWLGIEPHRRPGVEPHGSGNEPHGSGNEPHGSGNEPHRPGSNKGGGAGASASPLVAAAVNASSMALLDQLQGPDLVPDRSAADRFWQREGWVRGLLAVQALQARLCVSGGQLLFRPAAAAAPVPLLTLVAPTEARIGVDLEAVVYRRDERPERMAEIIVQVDGFWPFWTAVTGIDPAQAPRTAELVAAASALSPLIGQPIKQALDVRRPFQRSGRVQPAIPTPGHASYPSGHATAAHLEAAVLAALLKLEPAQLMFGQLRALAGRIADNREVAGVHYQCDSKAGAALGIVLADYVVASAGPGGRMRTGRVFDPGGRGVPDGTAWVDVPELPELGQMWDRARIELGVA